MLGIRIENDRLIAKVYLKEDTDIASITEQDITDLLQKEEVTFGLVGWMNSNWKEQLSRYSELLVAKGKPPVNGKDAQLIMRQSADGKPDSREKRNFRDVISIPMVEANDVLAHVLPATEGEAGTDVFNKPIIQRKGRPLKCKAGNHVLYRERERVFEATASGQLSIGRHRLHVYPLYEVNGDLTMETGNIQFNGSVSINGNVPPGYQVVAKGDIMIAGIVEGASISAGGNIFINEGIAGMEKAAVQARGNIEATYIHQAEVTAGGDIRVRKSIMQSHCTAEGSILCKQGTIIGGSASSGQRVEVKDLGNVANSKTELAFGVNKRKMDRFQELKKEQNKLAENKHKLMILGNQLLQKKETVGKLLPKERIMLLRQRNMYAKISENLQHVNEALDELQYQIGDESDMTLIVTGKSYENVELTFGKYKRLLKQEYKKYQANLEGKEIMIKPL